MRSKFTTVPVGQPQVPEDAFLPQSKYFHTNAWKNGFDVSDAPEDVEPGSSLVMEDVEVTEDDHLIRAPGVTPTDALAHVPTQIFLHAGFQYASDMILLAPPFFGVKNATGVQWFDAGLQTAAPYGHTNFAGVLLMTNGSKGIYYREPNKLTLNLIPKSVAGFGLAVFAGRIVVGGAQLDGKLDFMGIAWNDSSGDYKGWDPALGAAGQSMIGTSDFADRFQAFAALGFDTLVVVNRRSIWIGVQTGDVFQPIRLSERLKNVGCVNAATVQATEFGVLFLADDGVRLFTGNDAQVVSLGINRVLGPIRDSDAWTSSFDPFRKRYYLHGPTGTWIFDLKMRRWFHWLGVFSGSVFFPTQGTQITWGQAVGTWGSQTLAWWQLLPQESGGSMFFTQAANLGVEDPASFAAFGVGLQPKWFDRTQVAENQDVLATALGARFTYEASDGTVEIWLPDKPEGNYELVTTAYLRPPAGFTKRAWVPFIHTGRGIGLGLRITAGSPRIRRASVEYQVTSLPWEIEDTLTSTTQSAAPLSQAIIKARALYYNGYDLGVIQSTRRDFPVGSPWVLVASGGRDGGGYALSVKNAAPTGGQFSPIDIFTSTEWGVPEDHPFEAGCVIAFNLFGQALLAPMNCIGLHDYNVGLYGPQVVISVRPDLKLQASLFIGGVLVPIQDSLGNQAISTALVPATGWFALEPQIGISQIGNDKSGFVSLQLYTIDGPPEGVEVIRLEGVKTRSQSNSDAFNRYTYGTEVVPDLGPGLNGIGVDDVHLYGAYGTIKRLMYNTFIGPALPVADGDIIQSTVDYDSSHDSGAPEHLIIGGATNHGVLPRVNNLSGGPTRPDLDEHVVDETTPNNLLQVQFDIGSRSAFTGIWIDGPRYFGADSIVRNTINDEQIDTFKVETARTGIITLLGLQPFIAQTVRRVYSTSTEPSFNWTGLHDGSVYNENATARLGVRIAGVNGLGRYTWNPAFGLGGPNWKPAPGYTKDPYSVHETTPSGGSLTPELLALVQVLIKGDLSLVTAHQPDNHWVEFDYIQAGLEFAYRKALINATERAPIAPVGGLVQYLGTDPNTRTLVVHDASVDWDGTVVSRVVDWGDGSPTEIIGASPRVNLGEAGVYPTLTHIYAGPGTYNVTVTATDSDGLVGVGTLQFVVPNQPPVADFTFAADPGDPTHQTINFTDASVDPDGSIASWDWDFGDGSPHSALQNPTHVYATPGTRTVTLTVTDNLGATDPQTHDVTTPLGGAARVNMPILWSDSLGAGLNQSNERYDFVSGSQAIVAAAGRNGKDAIKEGDAFGTWQYTFRTADPRAFQFGFDYQGQALPAKELPLFMVGNQNIAVVLRPDGKVRVYALDAGFVWQQVLETAAAVPTTGPVVGQLRFEFGAAGAGFVRLWINGEALAADPVAVNPGGSLTMVGDTFTFGTGSAGNYSYAPAGGFDTGKALTVWFDVAALDTSTAATRGDNPGDIHFALCKPQAIGTYNDTAVAAASDLQSDDHATTATTFTATGQKDTLTVNAPTLSGVPTILCVLPYYEAFRGGTIGTKTLAVLMKSGATLAQSPSFSASSSWTSRYHIIPADTADAWPVYNDPATAAAWPNAAAVGATEVGFLAVAINAGGTVPLSQLGYEVAYWDT